MASLMRVGQMQRQMKCFKLLRNCVIMQITTYSSNEYNNLKFELELHNVSKNENTKLDVESVLAKCKTGWNVSSCNVYICVIPQLTITAGVTTNLSRLKSREEELKLAELD